jgi:hypothetical protein
MTFLSGSTNYSLGTTIAELLGKLGEEIQLSEDSSITNHDTCKKLRIRSHVWSHFKDVHYNFILIENLRLEVAYCVRNHRHQVKNGRFSNAHSTQTVWS